MTSAGSVHNPPDGGTSATGERANPVNWSAPSLWLNAPPCRDDTPAVGQTDWSQELMIVHVLRFAFKESSTEAEIAAALESLDRMSKMDSVAFGVVGQYMSVEDDGFTHAFCFAIKDLESFEHQYMQDPIHREADFIMHPHVAKLGVFDLSDDMNPRLGELIMGVHQRRYDKDPELAELVGTIPDFDGPADESDL
jgi:hypothetical protein